MCDVYRAALSPISHKSTELIEHEHGAQEQAQEQELI